MKNKIFNFNLNKFQFELRDFSEITVTGEDALTFLNGQITTNVSLILPFSSAIFCRLDPKGRIKFAGIIANRIDSYSLFVETAKAQSILEDLDKFIVSEDVELNLGVNNFIYMSSEPLGSLSISCTYKFIPGFLTSTDKPYDLDSAHLDTTWLDFISSYSGELFPESVLSIDSTHGSKGCFVGQEVVSKIESNRGARKFPLILKLRKNGFKKIAGQKIFFNSKEFGDILNFVDDEEFSYFLVRAKREFQIEVNETMFSLDGQEFEASIFSINSCIREIQGDSSHNFFIEGVDVINTGDESIAEKYFSLSLLINPKNIDSLEAIGVLYGRSNRYNLAHKMMDLLLAADSNSVMAHTNKSLFFMNEGKIDEAEDQKELALKKSTGVGNNPSEVDKELEAKRNRERLINQLEMYKEVLEIDPDDSFASQKWLEINFDLGNYSEMLEFLNAKNQDDLVLSFIWRYKIADKCGEDKSILEGNIPKMLSMALKSGDQKSVDFLKGL